ncbi:hypothetical protein C8R46DRAFT_1226004 [Mycena filopes]|nr:hypothetical protein C8R46DRAFT_1226004 [Mycena filopes]
MSSGSVSLFKAQLLRSADAPLDIYWPNVGWSIGPDLRELVLAQCGRWRRLRLDETASPPPFRQLGRAVTLPHLRRLTLDNLQSLFDLTAPVLTELICLAPGHVQPLLSFAQRSGSALTKLVLLNFPVYSGLISVLQAFPAMTYLLVEAGDGDHGAFFAALTLSGSPSDLCPNLTSFLYGDFDEWREPPWDKFLAMIQSRFDSSQQNRCRLEFLRIFHYGIMDKPSEETWAGFQRVRDRGLDAEFLGDSATH